MKIEFEIDERDYKVWDKMTDYVSAKTGNSCLDINKFARNCFSVILYSTAKPVILKEVSNNE